MEGKRWTVRDRYGYEIYLTEERWEHIIDPENHPEMEAYIVTAYQKVVS